MVNIAKALVGLAAIALVLAVVTNFTADPWFAFASAEGFSSASTNLSLLAIALVLCFGAGRSASLT